MPYVIKKSQIVLMMLFFAAVMLAIGSVAKAAEGEVRARVFPDDEAYQQVVMRGELAQYLYESFSAVPDTVVTRGDGTTYLVRQATGIACARSDRFSIPHFACVSYYGADGLSPAGYIDPEFGGTAGISVGN